VLRDGKSSVWGHLAWLGCCVVFKTADFGWWDPLWLLEQITVAWNSWWRFGRDQVNSLTPPRKLEFLSITRRRKRRFRRHIPLQVFLSLYLLLLRTLQHFIGHLHPHNLFLCSHSRRAHRNRMRARLRIFHFFDLHRFAYAGDFFRRSIQILEWLLSDLDFLPQFRSFSTF